MPESKSGPKSRPTFRPRAARIVDRGIVFF
jgi:hypothetical protein